MNGELAAGLFAEMVVQYDGVADSILESVQLKARILMRRTFAS
jgi:hypothetical protein